MEIVWSNSCFGSGLPYHRPSHPPSPTLSHPQYQALVSQPRTLSPPTGAYMSATPVAPDSDEAGADGGGAAAALQSTGQQAQKLFGYMREGAGNLFKNIKESSGKVMAGAGR